MGSTNLFHFCSSPINYLTLNPKFPILNPNLHPQFHSSLSSLPKRGTIPNAFRGERFDFDDAFRREKRRNWWSDDDDSDDEEDEDDDNFGFWEEPNPIDWVFKVLSIFGWMVPAVMISTLLGTGSNSLIMALVVPLGQTALSLVMDRLGGSPSSRSNSNSRYKSRPRPKPGPRSRNRPGSSNRFAEAREARSKTSPGSWRTANSGSVKKGGESGSRYGGWDELDEQVGTATKFPTEGQS